MWNFKKTSYNVLCRFPALVSEAKAPVQSLMTLGLAMSHSVAVESRHTAHNTERTTSAALTHTIGSGFTHGSFFIIIHNI